MSARKKVLIVEDERPMAHALELKLNNSGFEAKAVFDGDEAMEAWEKEKFDLILLDLIMPRKDGFSVLKELKEKGNKTPVIVSTNLSQGGDREKAIALGAKDYFVKSDTPLVEVINHVKKILGAK